MDIIPIKLNLSNAYLIHGEGFSVLVDTGMPGEAGKILHVLKECQLTQLDWIFLTHAHIDHAGSVAALRRATGARVIIHEGDAQALALGKTLLGDVRGRGLLTAWLLPLAERLFPVEPVEADIKFYDRYTLQSEPLTIHAIHTPGHTVGSSSLLVNGQHAFVGDLLTTNGRGHPQRFFAHSWSDLDNSIAVLQALRPSFTYPGHGGKPLDLEGLLVLDLDSIK